MKIVVFYHFLYQRKAPHWSQFWQLFAGRNIFSNVRLRKNFNVFWLWFFYRSGADQKLLKYPILTSKFLGFFLAHQLSWSRKKISLFAKNRPDELCSPLNPTGRIALISIFPCHDATAYSYTCNIEKRANVEIRSISRSPEEEYLKEVYTREKRKPSVHIAIFIAVSRWTAPVHLRKKI